MFCSINLMYLVCINKPQINIMTQVKTTTDTAKVFLTDYASYNEGNQFKHGHWVDLTQFSDASELMGYIDNHFESVGIEDPEPMFTDFENFPKSLYSESMGEQDFEQIYKYIEIDFDNLTESDKLSLWAEYCDENNIEDQVYNFDDDFFEMFFSKKPMEAARAASFGNLNWSHDYIYFNGYGNLESTNYPAELMDESALLEWLLNR